VRAAGALLALLGIGLAARAGLLLAGRGRPQRGPRPVFVIAGPYLRLRNPLAGGVVVALAGTALALRSAMLALAAVLAWTGLHAWIVRIEEPRLRARFGAAYEAYLRAVPRWIPARRRSS
jgi:protein-S-isoprenylcysteine O-methyltransferase Ste14